MDNPYMQIPVGESSNPYMSIPAEGQKSQDAEAIDFASSLGRGLAKGVVGAPGIPGDIANLWGAAGDKLRENGYLPPIPQNSIFNRRFTGSGDIIEAAKPYVPALQGQPETTAGKYAQTVGEFVPTALAGGGGTIQNVAKYAVGPGIASEAAGQATEGTPLEPWARAAGAIGAGGLASVASRPSVAGRAIAERAGGMSGAQLDAMESLFRDAQAAGLPITRAEAAQAVTQGATGLADLQRIVEGQGGLREFMAQRPAQVESVGRRAIDQIAPTPTNPSVIGPQAAEAAQGIIQDAQTAINAQTRPLYQAAESAAMPSGSVQLLSSDPLYARELRSIRSDPALNRTIANLPDDSPVVADLVQRRLREQADNAATPGQASTSNLAAANYGDAQRAAYQESGAASPELTQARQTQADLRQQYLEPLVQGPLGKVANRPETRSAIEALFPRNPIPNSAGEVQNAVAALSARNPWAARQLVRAHVESVFNNATRDLQAGANQFGGASFRAQLVGNTQQAENLAAAIRALPNGQHILPGFDRMLQIMEATGHRQRIGSQTAFNQELQNELKGGTVRREAASLAAGGGLKLPERVKESFERWNIGRNTDEIARLLTDPKAGDAFRSLIEARNTKSLRGALARIVVMSSNAN